MLKKIREKVFADTRGGSHRSADTCGHPGGGVKKMAKIRGHTLRMAPYVQQGRVELLILGNNK